MSQIKKDIVTWLKQWFPSKDEINNSEPEYIVGTQTAATGTWTGVCSKLTEIKDGTTIFYYLPFNGSGNATLNLKLANGTWTGAKNCYFKGTTRLTTHYPANTVVGLTYTTKRDGGCWYVITPNDNNNENGQSYAAVTITSGEALTTQTLCGMKSDGKYYKLANGLVIDVSSPIIWTNGVFNNNVSSNNVWKEYKYANTVKNGFSTWNNNKMIYIEGTAYSNGKFTISSNILTQTLTNGRFYIPIGETYNTTGNFRFRGSPVIVFYYNGSNLIPASLWEGIPNKPSSFPPSSHNHDDRYFTETEINTKLGGYVTTGDNRLNDERTPKFTTIPNGTSSSHNNLNNYTTTGFYGQSANANTSYIDNLPNNTRLAFTLLVENFGGFVKQTLTFYTLNDPQTFIREQAWNGSSWGVWKEIAWTTDSMTPNAHTHDDRYFTETEVTTKLSGKSDSTHKHGSLANNGQLNSDIGSVNKVVVTDSSNNIKTISKLPFSKLNISASDIAGLGFNQGNGGLNITSIDPSDFESWMRANVNSRYTQNTIFNQDYAEAQGFNSTAEIVEWYLSERYFMNDLQSTANIGDMFSLSSLQSVDSSNRNFCDLYVVLLSEHYGGLFLTQIMSASANI